MTEKFIIFLSSLFFISPCLSQEHNLLLNKGLTYLGTPYVPHTLEFPQKERLIINKKQVDCTTFIEYSLAEALFEDHKNEGGTESEYLQKIRYRDGVVQGYTSRLHYVTEWIQEGIKNNFFKDVTEVYGTDSMYVALSYMSRHPQYYKHLSNSKERVQKIKEIEKILSGQIIKWLPKDDLPDEGLPWIKNGDIIALTVGIYGLDISHLGIAIYQNHNLHLLHASSTHGKVIIEPVSLKKMLSRNKNWTGIRVIRPIFKNTDLKEFETCTTNDESVDQSLPLIIEDQNL